MRTGQTFQSWPVWGEVPGRMWIGPGECLELGFGERESTEPQREWGCEVAGEGKGMLQGSGNKVTLQ